MIPISLIQSTAETLMDKAAIEIPEDYLEGLQAAANTEDGELSSFDFRQQRQNKGRFVRTDQSPTHKREQLPRPKIQSGVRLSRCLEKIF